MSALVEVRTHTQHPRRVLGRGPWDDEPDKVQWRHEPSGLPCLAVRGPAGSWCGYVGVAEGHPWFGRGEYDDDYEHRIIDVEVHGGVTYAAFCDGAEEDGICHVPEPGQADRVWWVGFDCSHIGDVRPPLVGMTVQWGDEWPGLVSTYKTLAYVAEEVSRLAEQVAAAGSEA